VLHLIQSDTKSITTIRVDIQHQGSLTFSAMLAKLLQRMKYHAIYRAHNYYSLMK